MAWIVLLASAVLEAVWATALGQADGFTNVGALVVFVVALLASIVTLAWSAERIPIGTAYAVWTGTGAALTVGYAVLSGAESASAWKLVFIGGIVASVVGLKLLPAESPALGRRRRFGAAPEQLSH
jgi:quaternary ammonium compound-resistance protein SugE